MRRTLASVFALFLAIPAQAWDLSLHRTAETRDWRSSDFRAMGFVEIPLDGSGWLAGAPHFGVDTGPALQQPGFRRAALLDASFDSGLRLRMRGQTVLWSSEESYNNSLQMLADCFFSGESLEDPQCWAAYVVGAALVGGAVMGGLCLAEVDGICDDDHGNYTPPPPPD